jgi:hypothetical protein
MLLFLIRVDVLVLSLKYPILLTGCNVVIPILGDFDQEKRTINFPSGILP